MPYLYLQNNLRLIFLIFFLSFLSFSSNSQQLAFPSAIGAGAYTIGGRGGKVVHVTNLNNSGAGSLRWALTDVSNKSESRTIVFDVSGIIDLQSDIYMSNMPGDEGGYADGISILGQTAPEGGITITGAKIRIFGVNQVIVRYLKFRSTGNYDGCFTLGEADNFIFDHLSGSNTPDIVFSVVGNLYPGDKHTIQNCLMAQSKNGLIVGDSSAETNGSYGSVSVLRNAYYNVGWRAPMKMGGSMEIDAINNIVHNWSYRLIRSDAHDFSLNHIGNYYQSGSNLSNRHLQTSWNSNNAEPRIYNDDNYISDNAKPSGYDSDESIAWKEFQTGDYTTPLPANWFVPAPFDLRGKSFAILPSSEVKSSVLPLVGASQYIKDDGTSGFYRDIYDTEHVNGIEFNSTAGRVTALVQPVVSISNTRPINFYQTNPHIPEAYLTAKGITGNASIHNQLQPSGYTLFEEYVNQVDTYEDVDAVGVDVSPAIAEIQIPETIILTATITPSNATNQNGVWSSSDESIATVDQNGVVTPISNGVVTITFTTSDGGFTDTSEITVFPEALQASAGDDQQICEGESILLAVTSNTGTSYLWSNGETTETIEVSPTETTTYSVVVSNELGEEVSDDITITVNNLPIANAGEDQTICEGESVTLTASGGTDYIWSNGETTASITVSPNVETTYTVEVISNNCSSTNAVTIGVNPSPEVTLNADMSIYNGDSTTLTAGGADTYQWNTGETTNTIVVTPSETTTYTVTGFANGCQRTVEVTVTVLEPINANAGDDVTICSGDSVTLNATGGSSYSWNSGETTTSIIVSPFETTTYTVTITDDLGGTDTDSVTVTVNETPNVTVSENITIIEGESTSLVAQGAESYLWSTGEASSTITVSPVQTTTYIVEGTTATCSGQAQVTVTVEALFQASAGADERVCDDSTYEVVLTANQGESYLWSTGETSQSIVVSPLSTTTYAVTVSQGQQEDSDDVTVYVDPSPNVTIVNGESVDILNGDFITLTASGANTYEWNNGATQPNIAVSPSTTTTYEVKGYIGECYDEKQVTVNVFQPVVADAGENISICLDEIATLTASGGDEYLWSTGEITQSIQVSPLETTQYSVTVFNVMDFDDANVMVEVDANCDNEPVEVGQESLDFMFDIFPNPASNLLNLKLSGSSLSSDVYIFDITGKLIIRTEISNEDGSPRITRQLDISAMQSGIYLVKLEDQDREIIRKLIVK